MRRVFIDMDGTIAEWKKDASIEEVTTPGYFKALTPLWNMINAIKIAKEKCPDVEFLILSSLFPEHRYEEEKDYWLDTFCRNLFDKDHRIYVTYGNSKSSIGVEEDDILLDDFTKNLLDWSGIGIKVLNGINNTNKTWTGYMVDINQDPEIIANTIIGIITVTKEGEQHEE